MAAASVVTSTTVLERNNDYLGRNDSRTGTGTGTGNGAGAKAPRGSTRRCNALSSSAARSAIRASSSPGQADAASFPPPSSSCSPSSTSSSSDASSSASSPSSSPQCSSLLHLHSHRQRHSQSKLPSFRSADLTCRQRVRPARVVDPSPPPPPPSQAAPLAVSASSPNPVPKQRLALKTLSPRNDIAGTVVATAAKDGKPLSPQPSAVTASPPCPPRAGVPSRASSSCQLSRRPPPSSPASTPRRDSSAASYRRPSSCPPEAPSVKPPTLSGSSALDKPPIRQGTRLSHRLRTTSAQEAVKSTVRARSHSLAAPERSPSGETAQGQRHAIITSKRLSGYSSSDESRASPSSCPPISYRSINKRHSIQLGGLTPGQVPPIRSFRSSGFRRSLVKGMSGAPRPYDLGDSYANSPEEESVPDFGDDDHGGYANVRDAPSNAESGRPEDAADVFLRIASEEPARRPVEEDGDDTLTSISGVGRISSHRRPLSTAVNTYRPASPLSSARRLSDHQDRSRFRYLDDDQVSTVSRSTPFRPAVRDKAASVHPGEDPVRTRSGGARLRPSPVSARSVVGIDNGQEGSIYARRRASITESNSTLGARTPGYRASGLLHGRGYGSSPLSRTVDYHSRTGIDVVPGIEGTESTASTTAPSTVWDELDDLKSRIHRLELTGKLPSTSGAAVSSSRTPDERPATATTTVTTMSLSPKRQGPAQLAETASATTSSQKATHPILHAALVKSRQCLSAEVYQALESAAHDAMALLSMMGSAGQPGPMSGAASTIGANGSPVTDRQLRRKADSVCRGLTELCVALCDGAAHHQASSSVSPSAMTQYDGPATPTVVGRPYGDTTLPAPQKPSLAEQSLPPSAPGSSPRTLSKFEERRSLILNGTAGSVARSTTSTPSTPLEGSVPRRSSLLIGRTRRAGTEEPELGRTPTVLRSRRAVTEEPEQDGRGTVPGRRHHYDSVDMNGDEARFRPPSRANTDIHMFGFQGREPPHQQQHRVLVDTTSQTPSALPRPRFHSTTFAPSRLGGPQLPGRRYGDGHDADDAASSSPAEQRFGHHPPNKGIAHSRTSSLSTRRNRDRLVSVSTGEGYR